MLKAYPNPAPTSSLGFVSRWGTPAVLVIEQRIPGTWLQRERPAVDIAILNTYRGGMKVKTSITISEDLLEAIEKIAGTGVSRSEFIETATWAYIHERQAIERNARDLAILNEQADQLNAEAEDVLAYQAEL